MSKKFKYARNGALVLGVGNALINVNDQLSAMNKNPGLKFDWMSLIKSFGSGAITGGVGGLGIGAIADHDNSKIKPVKTDKFLKQLSERIKLDRGSEKYKMTDSKAQFLSGLLNTRFRSKLVSPPERLGSTEKGTALQRTFDIDLGLKFWHHSFASTAKMKLAVLQFLRRKVGKNQIVEVREQRASIGVLFNVSGNEFKIDVVPVKITEGNNHSGYLSITKPSVLGNDYSRQKTNIRILNKEKLSETQRRIVLVLKHWREKNEVPLGSHLLEKLVVDAYEYSKIIPKGFTKKIIMVFRHIVKNLDVAVIRGAENSNNIITKIDPIKKDEIISACRKAVEEYEYQPNSIKKLF